MAVSAGSSPATSSMGEVISIFVTLLACAATLTAIIGTGVMIDRLTERKRQ